MKKISVIVPIYNVEEYLAECLDSLANQDFDNYEVLMINDGSTDSSQLICEEYEKLYSYFTLYNKPNGGLGQARNYGMDRAFSDFYFFVDSDDIVAEDALSKLFDEAIKNKSDIVTGNVVRFNSKRYYSSKLHSMGEFSEYKAITTLEDTPELIYDVTSWNKLYRRTFLLENNLRFPEGIIYEDIPVTIPAHYLSKRTTIIPDIIYNWRERDGATKSLSQRNRELTNFHDRLTVMQMVDSFFDDNNLPESLSEVKMKRWLNLDFPIFLNLLKGANETYVQEVTKGIISYFKKNPSIANYFGSTSYQLQLYYNLLVSNSFSYDKLIELINWLDENPLINDEINYKNDKYTIRSRFDNKVYDITEFKLSQRVSRRLENVDFNKENVLIEGYGFHKLINMTSKNINSIKAFLINSESLEEVEVAVSQVKLPIVSFRNGGKITSNLTLKTVNNYDYCGIKITLPYNDLSHYTSYKLKIKVTTTGGDFEYYIGGPVKGNNPRPEPFIMGNDKISLNYDSNWDLSIVKNPVEAVVTKISINNNILCVNGWVPDDGGSYQSAFNNWQDQNYIIKPLHFVKTENGKKYFEYKQPLLNEKNFRDESNWFFYVRKNKKRIFPVIENAIRKEYLAEESYLLRQLNSGILSMKIVRKNAKIIDTKLNEDILSIKFNKDMDVNSNRLMIKIKRNANQEEYFVPVEKISEKEWMANVDINDSKLRRLGSGIWTVRLVSFRGDTMVREEGLIYVDSDVEEAVLKNKFRLKKFQTTGFYFGLRILPKADFLTDGPRRRKFYELNIYPFLRKLPLKSKNIVFESFWGKEFSDNPKAIYEYIDENMKDYNTFWAMQDTLPLINGNAKMLQIGTADYYRELARTKFLINNVNFPNHYIKRDDAIEINTMHGVPLKKMGFDFEDDFPNEKAKELFQEKINRWDYVISPSKYVSKIIRSAFNYKKEILEYGYPRNDELFSDYSQEINVVKEKLGVPLNKKVILYAPTWRQRGVMDVQIDFDRWEREFSDKYVLVVRYHHYNSPTISKTKYSNFVYNGNDSDVTVNDLMKMSDILITDYSSIMFDFSLLNKSMLFYVYDKEEYDDVLRGMYFDLTEEFPQICFDQEEDLIKGIHHINQLSQYTKTIAKRFNEFDNGHASQRVAEFIRAHT